ncbi:MAG: ATP-binding cassette domain-containing protein [Oscillospiraceae bacterium]
MIELRNVGKTYYTKDGTVEACSDINLEIKDGEIFGIIGFSGAGKSTLIRCINLLEKPTTGSVIVDGRDLTALLPERIEADLRYRGIGGFIRRHSLTSHKRRKLANRELLRARQNIGMIFQQFNLLLQKTALQNICFPLLIAGTDKETAKKRALELLDIVGIPDKANAYPSQLSGGQKQRVAIARALATEPKILLCDEATSALDPTTTTSILRLLKEINKKLGITIVIITHEMRVIEEICNRVAIMDDSRVAELGRVDDVFVNPKSQIGRKIIFPDGKKESFVAGSKCIRIVFDGETAFEPILGNMMIECGEPCNILYADTKTIDGKNFGQMVVQLPNNETAAKRMRAFLDMKKIKNSEEEFNDVQ